MPANIILFDFDGTLADSAQCAILATRQAFRDHHLPAPADAAIVQQMGIPIERCFRTLGATALDDDAFAALLATFRQHYAAAAESHIRLYPGIAALRANCEQLGISAHIDVFIGSDTVQHYKPHPEGIRLALAALDGAPAAALYIGDATTDIEMGHAAGVKTCAVTWGAHDKAALAASAPDFMVDDVAALQRLLLA